MSLILRSPEMASEKRVLGAHRKESDHVATSSELHPHEASAAVAPAEVAGHASLLEERLNEIEQSNKRSFEEAFESGLRAGEAEGREAYTSGLKQLESLTQSLNTTVQRSLEESEDMMVAIVYESVCKIVGDALTTKEGVAAVVQEALSRVRGKSAVIIRVNPVDLELIEASPAFGVASDSDWRADESIPMGGCVIESEYGTLDARIDTQLNQLKRVLLAARHKPVAAPGRGD